MPPVSRPPWRPPPDGLYRGPVLPRTNPRHLSILARRPGRLTVLDWGCGAGAYRTLVRDVLGHRYVGVDANGKADVRADVHRLPFAHGVFDHVITNAVLEHVADPLVAVREVARVLRPGGVFSGSAAFLEPHHQHSYAHFTADGLVDLLTRAGLVVEGLWPQEGWLVFHSLAAMPAPISGATRWVLRRLATLEHHIGGRYLHPRTIASGHWLRRKSAATRHDELLAVAGQIDFVAVKPAGGNS